MLKMPKYDWFTYSEHDKVVDTFVECDVDINMKDRFGKTALHVSIEIGK